MLWWFAQSTLVGAGLAVLAALACRSRRLGPEARHALWLVVLIKFAVPPVIDWPWPVLSPPKPAIVAAANLPGPAPILPVAAVDLPPEPEGPPMAEPLEPEPAGPEPELRAVPEPVQVITVPPDPVIPRSESLIALIPRYLWMLWIVGSVLVASWRVGMVIRFRRTVSDVVPAPGWLVEEVREIGDRLGVRPPPVGVTSGITTPLLWCLGRPRLLVPADLLKRLPADRWPGIMAHELAHLARNDHWVVRLELVLELIWWWNPVFALARRRLHEEAERACDARVVRDLPDRRFAYAEALVEVCEHLARSAIPSPALGVGGSGASRSLESRLTMILRDPIPRRPGRKATIAAGLLVALSIPGWSLARQDPPGPIPKVDLPAKPEKIEAKPATPVAPVRTEQIEVKPAGLELRTPKPPDLTIDEIRAGFAGRLKTLKNLSFRYSSASQEILNGSSETVRIQVGDVVLGLEPQNGLGAQTRLDTLTWSETAPDGPLWNRRFVAFDGSRKLTFQTSSASPGPIPFRWEEGGGIETAQRDDLSSALTSLPGPAVGGIGVPVGTHPAHALDLAGSTVQLLRESPMFSHGEVIGTDIVDGRPVVRMAWSSTTANGGPFQNGFRGLLWIAPDLNFAVVRSEATQDPFQVGRRTWRKTASDFVDVKGVWLPRKVDLRYTEAMVVNNSPQIARHQVITIDGYQADADLADDTFDPKFKIEGLDEKTGDFTTEPPALPTGLFDRLKLALRESPFGPPRIANRPVKTGDFRQPSAPAGSVPSKPSSNNADPTPASPIKPAEPTPAGEPARTAPAEPTESAKPTSPPTPRRVLTEEEKLARVRRENRRAELAKAEAHRELASVIVARNNTLKAKNANYVSSEEVAKAEAEYKIADAEVAARRADLDEAELLLEQAGRWPSNASDRAPAVAPPLTLADLRDVVELMEAQLQGKQAELLGAEQKSNNLSGNVDRAMVENTRIAVIQKRTEILESEIRLKQARRRVEAEEARIKRAIPRAKAQLDWSEEMFKKGYLAPSQRGEAQARYDELMIQLDPKYVPTPSPMRP